MSTDAPDADAGGSGTAEPDAPSLDGLQSQVEQLRAELSEVKAEAAAAEADEGKRMVIVATKGTLDMAYPPLILASTAAAFGWDVTVFHTFWGLDVLHRERAANLKLSAVGNPSMPMPNALATLPGMDAMATKMMEKKIRDNDTASIQELYETSLDMGVEFQACQMTMDLMGYEEEDLLDGVVSGVGAATALGEMGEADVQLLV